MYEHVMHEQQRERRGEGCTVSGRGAAGTASHVGDLHKGSDAKCRSAHGQRRLGKRRRRRRFPSLLRVPVDRVGNVGGGVWLAANLVPRASGPQLLYIAQCDRGPPTSLGLGAPDQGARLRGPVGRWAH
jgi:hypothetical protein